MKEYNKHIKSLILFILILLLYAFTIKYGLDLLLLIPQGLQIYLGTGDYYRLYNVSLGIYNEIPANQEAYNYVFLIYQKDNQRLIIFEYSLEYNGGVYEE